jgi:6-phosphogluconolactonase/glucosamine-6-phosphate isomerase/deaminase
MGILSFKTKDLVLKSLGMEIDKQLKKNWDKPILFFLPEYYSDEIFSYVSDQSIGRNITFSPSFERYGVSEDLLNARTIQKTKFWEKIVRRNCDFFDTGDLNKLTFSKAQRIFNIFIRKWLDENQNGIIMIIINMKGDGTVAGIKPTKMSSTIFEKLFCSSNTYGVGYERHIEYNPEKIITVTFELLQKCNFVYILVTGEANKDALQKLMLKKQVEDLSFFPIYYLRSIKNHNLIYFSDII